MSADRDAWLVAVHEASHAAVSEMLLNEPSSIRLWRASRGGASWMRGAHVGAQERTAYQSRMIGLAGAVGEVLAAAAWQRLPGQLTSILNRISPSDAVSAGHFDRYDIDECIALVISLSAAISARAEQEIFIFNERAALAHERLS